MKTMQERLLTFLPQQQWMSGPELLANFDHASRQYALAQLFAMVELKQVDHRRQYDQGVTISVFKCPIPEQGQISIF